MFEADIAVIPLEILARTEEGGEGRSRQSCSPSESAKRLNPIVLRKHLESDAKAPTVSCRPPVELEAEKRWRHGQGF